MSDELKEIECRLQSLKTSADNATGDISKLEEAVFHPDNGLYARVKEADRKIASLEEHEASIKRFLWFALTVIGGLILREIWGAFAG